MNIKNIEQYTHTRNEIRQLEERIQKLESKQNTTVIDVVSGSSLSFPYTKHTIRIEGMDITTDERILRLKQRLHNRKIKLLNDLTDIEKFLDSISDSEIRQIIQFKYVDGLPWKVVSRKVYGYPSEDRARKKITRFFAEN